MGANASCAQSTPCGGCRDDPCTDGTVPVGPVQGWSQPDANDGKTRSRKVMDVEDVVVVVERPANKAAPFHVSIEKGDGQSFGIRIAGVGLVTDVFPDGAVAQHNQNCPERQIEQGCIIYAIDGVSQERFPGDTLEKLDGAEGDDTEYDSDDNQETVFCRGGRFRTSILRSPIPRDGFEGDDTDSDENQETVLWFDGLSGIGSRTPNDPSQKHEFSLSTRASDESDAEKLPVPPSTKRSSWGALNNVSSSFWKRG